MLSGTYLPLNLIVYSIDPIEIHIGKPALDAFGRDHGTTSDKTCI